MTVEGMGPSLAVEGATDREVFEAYVEKMLAPSLQAEQVVVMDNLSAHKGERECAHWSRSGEPSSLVPAALLSGPQPHRRSLRQDRESPAQSRGSSPRGFGGGDGTGDLGGQRS
jgi:hypothetical protein